MKFFKNINKINNIYLLIFAIFIIIILFYVFTLNTQENYINIKPLSNDTTNDNYLYPIKKLQPICSKEGLKPSYMPKACFIDGKMNSYANCKCEDNKGNCKICYPVIKKDDKSANVVYSSDWS